MPVAISDPYVSVNEYRSQINKSDAGSDADVEQDLLAISRWLDRRLNRFFTRDAADVTRIYNPIGYSRYLYVDDMSVAPTSVTIDRGGDGLFTNETALAITDYELLPRNALLGPESQPYTCIYLPGYNTTLSAFVIDQRVRVITRFGWPAVPMAIQRGTIELTAIWRLESPRSTTRVSEMGDTFSTSRVAQNLVNDLVRQYSKAGSLVV